MAWVIRFPTAWYLLAIGVGADSDGVGIVVVSAMVEVNDPEVLFVASEFIRNVVRYLESCY